MEQIKSRLRRNFIRKARNWASRRLMWEQLISQLDSACPVIVLAKTEDCPQNSYFFLESCMVCQWPSRNKIVFISSRKTKILTVGIHLGFLRIEIFV